MYKFVQIVQKNLNFQAVLQGTVDDPVAVKPWYMIKKEMTFFLGLILSLINCDLGQGICHLYFLNKYRLMDLLISKFSSGFYKFIYLP